MLDLFARLSEAITVNEVMVVPAGGSPPANHPSRTWLPQRAWQLDTGLFAIISPQIDLVIAPPFPITGDLINPVDLDSIKAFLELPRIVVVVLLRLGSYAVGVIDDGAIASSKSGTRYVKGRHKAEGQSQRRFERNREKWVRELFDRVCLELTKRLPEDRGDIDHIALGGDRHILDDFVKRCPAMKNRLTAVR